MYTHTFQALGTQWWVEVFDEDDSETFEGAVGTLERFTRDFESRYSRFKPDSLISKLNRERKLENPDEECRALLGYGKQLYLRSNTIFNLLTGHIQEARGYGTTTSVQSTSLTPGNPITDLLISEEKIELLHGNIDLGGFGKGYLIDKLTSLLREQFSLQYFLINGGGDMYGTSKQDEPIQIFLEHPTKPSHFVHATTLKDQGFAASSPFKRVWNSGDKTYTHIISNTEAPRVASFVKAESARDADAFATAALLLEETELTKLAAAESLGVARFSPATNLFWQTSSFQSPTLK
ncbi:MAG: FAD:protein FMN transferase [Candidatus Pacebacteria bacterium]|nr:FAD:protein FMN transferase [Candidatus Paceibacterota bacterium]